MSKPKRQMTAQGRAALENRQGSRTSRIDPRRVKGGRPGAKRAAIKEASR